MTLKFDLITTVKQTSAEKNRDREKTHKQIHKYVNSVTNNAPTLFFTSK